jgi:hypothetical protein
MLSTQRISRFSVISVFFLWMLTACSTAPKAPSSDGPLTPLSSEFARKIKAPSVAEAQDALGVNVKLDQRQLSNGLTVIMVEDHTVPVVAYQTWFKVGSVDERFGRTGMAHLFEHLMFKGTPKYGPKQFFLQLEAKGADVNAFTTRDYTVFHETFVSTLLPKVIDMEADRMAIVMPDRVVTSTVSAGVATPFSEVPLNIRMRASAGRLRAAVRARAARARERRIGVIL